jgi:manganese transport protein
MLVQYLSAKIGVATGKDLPELCREQLGLQVSAYKFMCRVRYT